MVSESYNISASWGETWTWYPPQDGGPVPYPAGDWSAGYQVSPSGTITGGYNLSSSDGMPLSASTAAPSPLGAGDLRSSASIGLFSVQNSTYAAHKTELSPAPLGGYVEFVGAIETSLQADWLFSPIGNSLEVHLNANLSCDDPNTGGFLVTLTDMTDSTTLLNLAGQEMMDPHWAANTFAVNPSDIYEFSISETDYSTYDLDALGYNVTASITSVPEPGVCQLLSLGLAGLLGFKGRFRN
jgi:hypothetical protein